MIDTLRLRLHDPRLKPENMLRIPPVTHGGSHTGLVHLHYVDGQRVVASRVRYQGAYYQVYSAHGDIYLSTSLPRVKSNGGTNLVPVTKEELPAIIQRLQGEIERIGMVTDLREALVSRMDVFADAATRYPFQAFLRLMAVLHIPRRTSLIYPGSYTFKNTQREDQLYDKRSKLEEDGADVTGLPAHLMRYEARMMRAASVKTLGVRKLADLERRWDVIRDWFASHVRRVLRYEDDLPSAIDISNVVSLLEAQKEAKKALFAQAVLQQVGSLDELRRVLGRQRWNDKRRNRMVKAVVEGLQFPFENETVSINDLKRELFSKLMAGLGEGDQQ